MSAFWPKGEKIVYQICSQQRGLFFFTHLYELCDVKFWKLEKGLCINDCICWYYDLHFLWYSMVHFVLFKVVEVCVNKDMFILLLLHSNSVWLRMYLYVWYRYPPYFDVGDGFGVFVCFVVLFQTMWCTLWYHFSTIIIYTLISIYCESFVGLVFVFGGAALFFVFVSC